MPSPRKTAANRANAQRSTGPRSKDGKATSSLNARKHGLAVPASALPEWTTDLAHLARMIAGEDERDARVLETAAQVATAAIDVLRTRRAKTELLDRMACHPYFLEPPPPEMPMPERPPRLRFTRAAWVRAYLNGTHQELHEAEMAQFRRECNFDWEVSRIKQQRADTKQRLKALHTSWDQLERLDRYERRALSRRNTAIRAFDEARAAQGD